MVTCSSCGKVIEKVPEWLTGVTVEFVCTNCPNRQTKNIAQMSNEADAKAAALAAEAAKAAADAETAKA